MYLSAAKLKRPLARCLLAAASVLSRETLKKCLMTSDINQSIACTRAVAGWLAAYYHCEINQPHPGSDTACLSSVPSLARSSLASLADSVLFLQSARPPLGWPPLEHHLSMAFACKRFARLTGHRSHGQRQVS